MAVELGGAQSAAWAIAARHDQRAHSLPQDLNRSDPGSADPPAATDTEPAATGRSEEPMRLVESCARLPMWPTSSVRKTTRFRRWSARCGRTALLTVGLVRASQPGSQHVDLAAWRGRVEAAR
jgi:hypothetical protein